MNVAVLGARSAGRDVASICARAGHAISLHDEEPTRAMDRIDDIERVLYNAVGSGLIRQETKDEAMDALEATTNLSGAVSDADLVIDTRIESSDQLQERFAEIESAVGRETLITSSRPEVSVTAAAAGLRHPDRALGIHFLAVPEPSVVELLIAEQTAEGPAVRAEEFVESLGAIAVRVKDLPGVASDRLQIALEAEAMRTVDDGVTGVEGVDTVLREGHGYPEGPLEHADRMGLDNRLATLEALEAALGERFEPPAILEELVADGNTGSDAGEGFYRWEAGDPVEPAIEAPTLTVESDQPDDPADR